MLCNSSAHYFRDYFSFVLNRLGGIPIPALWKKDSGIYSLRRSQQSRSCNLLKTDALGRVRGSFGANPAPVNG